MFHFSLGLQGLVASNVSNLLPAATCLFALWGPSTQAIGRAALNHGPVGHSSEKNVIKVFLDYPYASPNTEKSQGKT
jgi:hypothetical protein